MKQKIFVVLLLIFGFASVYYSDNGLLPYPEVEFADETTYPVLKVIDAATVEIHYEGAPTRVTLIGVQVPETMHPTTPLETARAAAAAFLHNLLLGESVYLQFEADTPTQAYLYRAPDGQFVNLEVVRQGYAAVNAQATFKHVKLFAHYAERARTAEKGLWAPIDQGTLPDDDTLVYVTRSGKKYHRENCIFVKRSKRASAVSLELAKQKRTPCSTCNPPE